jgi:predicted GIY-YIG superfamily endonuclease
LVVYIAAGFDGRDDLLAKLGKHKTGKVCVYIKRLANVDLKVLETLAARSVAETKRRYPKPQ